MAKICPVCGTENSDDALHCANCGATLTAPEAELSIAEQALAEADQPTAEDTSPAEQVAAASARIDPVETDLTTQLHPLPDDEPAPAPEPPPVEPPAPVAVSEPAPVSAPARDLTTAPLNDVPEPPAPLPPTPKNLGTTPLVTKPEAVAPGATAESTPTVLMPYASDLLNPLPLGALLDGRYAVRLTVERGAGRNTYRVNPRKQQRCPNCSAIQPLGNGPCRRCGYELVNQPAGGEALAAESYDRASVLRDEGVFARNLSHPHLLALVDHFSYTPYGKPRYYTLTESRRGIALTQVSLPQPAAQVLDWGAQLSAALAYLHTNNVISPGATPENIIIREQDAILTNIHESHIAPEDPAARAKEVAGDIARLAGTLYETMTGKFATVAGSGQMLDESFPPEAEQLFARALRPPKDAAPLTDEEWGGLLLEARHSLAAAGPGVSIRSGRLSNVGRVRELNEDSVAVVECQVMQDTATASLGVYVVADGMGGHQSGEVASAIAISSVTESLVKQFVAPQFNLEATPPDSDQIRTWLTDAVQIANARIHQQRTSYHNDMGTTTVAALVAGQRVYIANVGDSRAYVLQPAEDGKPRDFRQITVDHSLVQRLVSTGQITEEEAKFHPYRNVIYNSLGEKPQAQIDVFTERVRPGLRLLICSDGLSNMLTDEFLAEILSERDDPQAACAELVQEANNAGGIDNISVIAVYMDKV